MRQIFAKAIIAAAVMTFAGGADPASARRLFHVRDGHFVGGRHAYWSGGRRVYVRHVYNPGHGYYGWSFYPGDYLISPFYMDCTDYVPIRNLYGRVVAYQFADHCR